MRHHSRFALLLIVFGTVIVADCAGKLKTTSFLHPEFDFSYVERVAVLPIENLSADRDAGRRATRLMVTELLASGAVEVIEPGEVRAALTDVDISQVTRAPVPSSEQVIALGKQLRVQALLLGSVTQSEVIRTGAVGMPVVTLDAHLVETDTGTTIWAATHTEKGSTFSGKVLGAGGEAISETTRRCVRALVNELVE